VLLVTSVGFLIYEVISFKAQVFRNLSTLSAVIADNSAVPLAFSNKETATDILTALKAEPDIVAAALYSNGHLFASYPPDLKSNLLPVNPGPAGHQFSFRSLQLVQPVFQEGKPIGTLYIRSSLRALYQRLSRFAVIVAVILSISVAAAYVLSTLLQRRVSRPILALTHAAQSVSKTEDYSIRAPKLSDDEVGILTDAFNKMLAETQAHHASMAEQQNALRENEARKSAILESALDCIISMDVEGRITEFNPAAEKTFAWSRQDALGKSFAQTMIPAELRDTHWQAMTQLLQSGTGPILGRRIELTGLRADGARFPVELSISVSRLPGHPPFFTAYLRDLTEAKKAEEQLRESEERFRTLGENIAQLAWMAAPTGSIFWYNKRWYDYTGTTPEQMLGWGWAKVQHPDHLARVTQKWRSHLERGEAWEDTFPLRSHNGEYRWFLSRAVPIRDRQGKIIRWFGTNTDITELRQTQEELKHAQQELQEHAVSLEAAVADRTAKLRETVGELEAFSYSISHDMRGPLRAMTAYALAIKEDFGAQLPPPATKYLNSIMSAATRLDQLITDVLSYSRIARGQQRLDPIHLEAVIAETISHYPVLQPPAVEIEIQTPLPAVLGDQASLAQCISNLLTNAVKFVPAGTKPRIRIWAEETSIPDTSEKNPAGFIHLNLEDNGIGIAKQDLQRIFGIFERVHSQNAYEGTGIGLAIVKKAVERMGGQVGVDSTPGRGSRFWLQLKKA
jgi:PAS domain S-box-containing protein